MTERIDIFKKCFSKISVKELNDRIKHFKNNLNLKTISDKRLKEELRKLFSVELDGQQVCFFLKSDTYTNKYEHFNFYRIRKFSADDYKNIFSKDFPSMQIKQDVWARPSCDVNTFGRLNRKNESMLYLAHETTNAIYETECKINEFFFLLVYENKKRMRLSQIHNVQYFDELTEEENAKLIILHNFLLSEFTKIVTPKRDYLYRGSISIYEEFFLSDDIDGFCYPSTRSQTNRGFNICFTQDKAEENLNFVGIMVCELLSGNEISEFTYKHHYDGFLNETGNFEFHPAGSAIAEEKFGRFAMRRKMGL